MHFGLIGYPLTHSFSPAFFAKKFQELGILDATYTLFPLENIQDFPNFIAKNQSLTGFNVTIPHKQNIIPYLDVLDTSAQTVEAVNVVKITKNNTLYSTQEILQEKTYVLTGYNTDVYGFLQTIAKYLQSGNDVYNNIQNNKYQMEKPHKAMILGEGGASQAVKSVFLAQKIPFEVITRNENTLNYHYKDITPEFLSDFTFIVNTTPVGMYPNIHECPFLPYNHLRNWHILIDLIYNPAETLFLAYGKAKGCHTENGLVMLHEQAEKAWEIWQKS